MMGYSILWLEDDIEAIGTLTRPLERDGHVVEKVQACIDAVARLGFTKYDAVLLDIILPRDAWTREHGTYNDDAYFGIDVLRFIRAQSSNPQVPVVVFSALHPEDIQREINQAGLSVTAILQKPVTSKLLKEKILEAIVQSF